MPVEKLISLRNGTAAAWTAANPVLGIGEPGVELAATPAKSARVKFGDGVTPWSGLKYEDENSSSGGGTGGPAVDQTARDAAAAAQATANAAAATVGFRGAWAANTAYKAGQLVVNPSGVLVSAKTDFTSGSSYTKTNWSDAEQREFFRGPFAASTDYKAGDVVSQAAALYQAIADFTSGATFDVQNWTVLGGSAAPAALATLTDVSLVSPGRGDELIYEPDTSGWRKRVRQQIYFDDYLPASLADPGQATGTQNVAAMKAAYAAAVAAPRGAVVNLPGRILSMDSSAQPSTVMTWSAAQQAGVTIKGAGRNATIIKLSSNNRLFCTAPTGSATTVYRDLYFEDFTVDGNFQVTSGLNGVLFGIGGTINIAGFGARRVDVINVPAATGGTDRRCVDITLFRGTAPNTTRVSVVDVTFEDCNFGRTGGGGNYGILMQGYAEIDSIGTVDQLKLALEPGRAGIANVWFDRITVTRCQHDPGLPAPANLTQFSATGFMFGSHGLGGRLRITDCYAKNSYDDCFEINSWYDAVLTGCVAENGTQEGFYFINIGGMPEPDKQHIKVINCRTVRNDSVGTSQSIYGFRAVGVTHPHGHLTFDNCSSVGDAAGPYLGQQFDVRGNFRKLTIRNFVYSGARPHINTAASGSIVLVPVNIAQRGGRGKIEIDGIHSDSQLLLDTPNSDVKLLSSVINLDLAIDCDLDVRDVDARVRMRTSSTMTAAQLGTTVTRGVTLAGESTSSGLAATNLTWSATSKLGNYFLDAGALADFVPSTDGLQITGTPTAEKRLRGYVDPAGAGNAAFGPATDASVWSGALTPTAIAAGFKVGAVCKALDSETVGDNALTASTSYIEGYLTDDGATSFLCLDKVVGGTRTSLLGAIVGGLGTVTAIASPSVNQSDRGVQIARLVAATNVYVRTGILDNTVIAEQFTTAPSTGALDGTAAATTGTITLATADAQRFGGVAQGRSMQTFVAVDSTSRLTRYVHFNRHVIRGRFHKLVPQFGGSGTNVKTMSALYTPRDSTRLRIPNLELHTDLSRAGCTTISELESFDSTLRSSVRLMPGTLLGTGRRLDQALHPDLVATGGVAGGSTGTALTIDVGRAPYWFQSNTLTGNAVLTLLNVPAGGTIDLELTQDATGSRTVTFAVPVGGTMISPGGLAALTGTALSKDLVTLYTPDGLNFRVLVTKDLR